MLGHPFLEIKIATIPKTPPMKTTILFFTLLLSGCADPLWHREGGILNPWGGEFLTVNGHTPCGCGTCWIGPNKCSCIKSKFDACGCR